MSKRAEKAHEYMIAAATASLPAARKKVKNLQAGSGTFLEEGDKESIACLNGLLFLGRCATTDQVFNEVVDGTTKQIQNLCRRLKLPNPSTKVKTSCPDCLSTVADVFDAVIHVNDDHGEEGFGKFLLQKVRSILKKWAKQELAS